MSGIDYVVPMVFNGDALWREDLNRSGGWYNEGDLINFVRYRSWGTERLLVDCVKKFMPWIRRIHILLARESQVQEWMMEDGDAADASGTVVFQDAANATDTVAGSPTVMVVFHREFMPEEVLPTFNSRAIEMYLHRIPGLSERFIYGNDDMFPLSPMSEEDFFQNGKPCLHHTLKPLPDHPNNFQKACLNGLNFVGAEFGRRFDGVLLKGGHSLSPILKGTCEHLWERGGDEIRRSVSRFREVKNFNQYIYSWWQHLSGEYVDSVPVRHYMGVNKNSVEEVVDTIMRDYAGVVCINDHECVADYQRYGKAVRAAIERKLREMKD